MSAIFYSSVKEKFLRRRLFVGLIPAILGGVLLLLSPGLLSTPNFQKWGWLIFIVCFIALSLGLLPYKKLQRENIHPSWVEVSDEGSLWIGRKEIPLNKINAIYYFESIFSYGIKIDLKDGTKFTLPFFSRRSSDHLRSYISVSEID